MDVSREEWGQLREDVGFIKAHITTSIMQMDAFDDRVTAVEKEVQGLGTFRTRVSFAVTALLAFLGISQSL